MTGSCNGRPPAPLLEVVNLACHFGQRRHPLAQRRIIRAVDDVTFTLEPGESLALVGESGSGKTTVARLVLGILPRTSGDVRVRGEPVSFGDETRRKALSRSVQMIFQNPLDALDPLVRVRNQIIEPLHIHGLNGSGGHMARASAIMADLGLESTLLSRYPHELSGGQLQRVVIARALVLEPQILVCDEPLSALDVSIQAQTIDILKRQQRATGMAYLFITHDLRVVRHMAERIAVMYLGRLVEEGPVETVLHAPQHPYTRALVASVPGLSRRDRTRSVPLSGEPPKASSALRGCRFHPRCPLAEPRCRAEVPELLPIGEQHRVSCHVVCEGPMQSETLPPHIARGR